MTDRAVFLDRDGVLNEECGYITRPEDLQPIPGALEAVARITRAGWPVCVFTNQAGVGRGLMTLTDLEAVHARLLGLIAGAGGALAGIYACPHHPDDGCGCRKPRPGLLETAAREHALRLTDCWVVGDSRRDIEAGRAAGCRTILVLTGHTRAYDATAFQGAEPDLVLPDLAAVADWLLRNTPSSPPSANL